MILLDRMVQTGRLAEFVEEFVSIRNTEEENRYKEKEDAILWDFWLHRVYEMSYEDFRTATDGKQKAAPTPEEIISTVKDSKSILAGFVPNEGLVGSDDCISAAGDNRNQ